LRKINDEFGQLRMSVLRLPSSYKLNTDITRSHWDRSTSINFSSFYERMLRFNTFIHDPLTHSNKIKNLL